MIFIDNWIKYKYKLCRYVFNAHEALQLKSTSLKRDIKRLKFFSQNTGTKVVVKFFNRFSNFIFAKYYICYCTKNFEIIYIEFCVTLIAIHITQNSLRKTIFCVPDLIKPQNQLYNIICRAPEQTNIPVSKHVIFLHF